MSTPGISTIEDAIAAIAAGRPVIVADDEDRENEGDVILSAELATSEWIAWTVRWSSGLLGAPMPNEIADQLDLPMMVERNDDARGTAYTVTVDGTFESGGTIVCSMGVTYTNSAIQPRKGKHRVEVMFGPEVVNTNWAYIRIIPTRLVDP